MCDVDGTDPFTDAWQLCDDDGIVRSGAMHKGTDYPCTGHAHIATPAGRYHIRCTSPAHRDRRIGTTRMVNAVTTWQPAHPGDTPGQLVPGEADQPQPLALGEVGQQHCPGCRCTPAIRLGDGLDLSRMTIYRTSYG